MPNVMGREFPYTAEGMAAAQQYSQAMGMRDGGSMGFRPIGMQAGGVADESTNIVRGLYDLMSRGTTDQVRNYIEANRADLQMISKDPNPMFNMLRSVLPNFPPTPPPTEGTLQPMQVPPQGMKDFPGYEPETGDFYPPPQEQGGEFGKDLMDRGPFVEPTNPATGLPWTNEERGPLRRIPKEDGFGYYTGDNSGIYGETLEYVPSRYPTGPLELEPMANGGIMSLGRR